MFAVNMPTAPKHLQSWRRAASFGLLFLIGLVIVPLTTWWYVPVALWWFFRAVTQTVSGIWVLFVAVVLSFQMAVLVSLPVGLVLIVVSLLLWSLENITSIKNVAMRWALEIVHGVVMIGVVLGLNQAMTFERFLFNSLAILVIIAAMVLMGQRYET